MSWMPRRSSSGARTRWPQSTRCWRRSERAVRRHPDAILVSALTGEGIEELQERIEAAFEETLREVELLVPYSEGARMNELHELAGELERTDRGDGVLVRARVPAAELHRFKDLSVNGAGG